jgi:hypothetical protein
MMELVRTLRNLGRYPDYRPQPVTWSRAIRWMRQFESCDRRAIRLLLDYIVYFSEETVRRVLVEQNEVIMKRLLEAGLPPERFIYVQVHEAGCSSPVMLNLLRDAAGLEQRGCRFMDANDTLGLNRLTNDLGEGALIYVDDFVGTGTQFSQARDFAAQFIEGSFAEFLLAPCVCEEAFYPLGERGIEAFAGHVHAKSERPLHANSRLLQKHVKNRLIEICQKIDPNMGLGWLQSAAMVVLYRNAPDNIPILFRGSPEQNPFVGIFPRTTDLPLVPIE